MTKYLLNRPVVVVALLASPFALLAHAVGAPATPAADMNKVLTELKSEGGKPVESLTAVEARKQPSPADAVKAVMTKNNVKKNANDLAEVREIQVQGGSGKIPARLYIPKTYDKRVTLLPVVVYYHGGGFVIADNDTYDATPRSLAAQTGAIFISVEYRKGPENKFPAAHDDAFAAYQWVLTNAKSFGGDSKRIAVAGESAGGNLALNVAIMARDKNVQAPVYELLIYPVAGNDMTTESYTENADAKPLNKPMMEWFIKQYVRSPEDTKDSRLNLMAADVHGLSPATVITAQIDPLRSEGKALADKLKAAGVKVDYKNYNGVTHEFFGMASVVSEAKKAQSVASSDLKGAFKN